MSRGERGKLAPHVLLTWLLPTYDDVVFMLHKYQPEYQELMAAEPVFCLKIIMTNHFLIHVSILFNNSYFVFSL